MKKNKILEEIKKLRVLICGDIMLDRYLYGNVSRISPEAPVPILDFTSLEEKVGGAGNVAANISALEAHVDICGYVGKDIEGEKLLKLLKASRISTEHIITLGDHPTTLKTRVIGSGQHMLRVDRESKESLSHNAYTLLTNTIESIDFNKYDLVILQDYDKGFFDEFVINKIIQNAKAANCFVSVDPKIENFWNYKGVNLIKPNKTEAEKVLQRRITTDNINEAVQEILNRLEAESIIITLGAEGMYYMNNQYVDYFDHGKNIEVADVCGAGDAVISIAAPMLALHFPIPEVLKLSNKVGAYVCQHIGVKIIDNESIIHIQK